MVAYSTHGCGVLYSVRACDLDSREEPERRSHTLVCYYRFGSIRCINLHTGVLEVPSHAEGLLSSSLNLSHLVSSYRGQ